MALNENRLSNTMLLAAFAIAFASASSTAQAEPLTARRGFTASIRADGINNNERKAGPLKVKFGKLTLVAEYFEYNPDTCAEISPGTWTVKKKAKHGTVKEGTGSYTIPSGDCAGDTYTVATINYTWTDSNTTKTKDSFSANWTTPDGEFDYPLAAKIKLVK